MPYGSKWIVAVFDIDGAKWIVAVSDRRSKLDTGSI